MNIAVTGACGRMGSGIIKTILDNNDLNLSAAIEAPNNPKLNTDIGEFVGVGELNIPISSVDDLAETLENNNIDVLVDFTIASSAINTIKIAAESNVNLVVGTTGLSEEQLTQITEYISENNIKAVISPNMAVGVNILFKILEDVVPLLNDYDIEIIEAHHRHKKDAPSGTATKLFEIIANNTDKYDLNNAVYGRHGLVGERKDNEIGIHAVRGGDIFGDHTILFAGDGERIEITHRANNRQSFINGVIKAIKFIPSSKTGIISNMDDVLNIKRGK